MATINFKQVKSFNNISNTELGFAPIINLDDYFAKTGAHPRPSDLEEVQTLERRASIELHPNVSLKTEVMFCDFFKLYFGLTSFRPQTKEDEQTFLIYIVGLFCENGILETLPPTKDWTKDNVFRTGYGGAEIEHFTAKPKRYFFRKFVFEEDSLGELTIFVTENRSALVIDMEFLRRCYIKSLSL